VNIDLRRVLGLALLVTWAPYVLTLWPINHFQIFAVHAFQFGLGICAGILALGGFRGWRAWVLASAGVFLLLTASDTFGHLAFLEEFHDTFSERRPEGFWDRLISAKIVMASRKFQLDPGIDGWFFAYHWLVMPVIQVVAIISALSLRTSNRSMQPTRNQRPGAD
jgi:hypothetical protein